MKAVSLCQYFVSFLGYKKKNLTSAFSKNKGNLLLVDLLAALPWQRYLLQFNTKYQIHANFGHPEVRSFEITFTNN